MLSLHVQKQEQEPRCTCQSRPARAHSIPMRGFPSSKASHLVSELCLRLPALAYCQ